PPCFSWVVTTPEGAQPLQRFYSTLVSRALNTGGRYNPGMDSWRATRTAGAPAGRVFHTAVRTENEMIVWGGAVGALVLNSGGRYSPGTNTWTATSIINAPTARSDHRARSGLAVK